MAEARAAATPFQKLAAAFGAEARMESRDGAAVDVFKVERETFAVEVSLSHGTPPVLMLRAMEEEPAPSSASYRQSVMARVRRRLVYPPLLLRKTTSLDRVNALLALRFDTRTGDAAFDRAVTIEADVSDDVILQTLAHQDARAAVLDILAGGMTVRFEERALCAELLSSDVHIGALRPAIEAMFCLAAGIPRSDPAVFSKRPMPGRVLTGAIIVIGLLAAGALAPGTLDDPGIPVRPLPRPLLPLPIMLPGVAAGAAAFVVVYLLLRWQLKRRNTSTDLPLVMALLVVLSVLGIGFLDGANRLLDEAPIAVHDTKVTGKDTGTSRKSGAVIEWMLIVPSWRPGALQLELSVEPELHRDIRVGDPVRITSHPGFFGFEWGAVVERGALVRSPEPAPVPKASD